MTNSSQPLPLPLLRIAGCRSASFGTDVPVMHLKGLAGMQVQFKLEGRPNVRLSIQLSVLDHRVVGVGVPESRLIPRGTKADVFSQVRHFAELSLRLRSCLNN